MKNGSGWYYFADGYSAWYCGLSAQELKREVQKHGKLLRIER